MVATFAIMTTFVIANVTSDSLPDQKIPLSTDGCPNNTISEIFSSEINEWRDEDYSFITKILSMSYMWYSGLGCSMTFLFGLIFSPLFDHFSKDKKDLVNPLCISPLVLNFFIRFFPEKTKTWIDLSTEKIVNEDLSKRESIHSEIMK